MQRNLKKPINNTPNPRKVAVFSDHFWKGHSVYRTLAHYIRALKESGLELTLIHAAPIPEGRQDTEIFSRVIQLPWNGSSLDIAAIESNDFGALIFPDVGMSLTSIFLANQHLRRLRRLLHQRQAGGESRECPPELRRKASHAARLRGGA